MDKALVAIYIAGASALLSLVNVIVTTWKFSIERTKFLLEIRKLKNDFNKAELTSYQLSPKTEVVVYDGRVREIENDFSGYGYKAWDDFNKKFLDPVGKGTHTFSDKTIIINRENTEGRYEIHLNAYLYKGNYLERIPVDLLVPGQRKMRITCDVKRVNANHTLRFLFKGGSEQTYGENEYRVFKDSWENVELVFSIPSNELSFLRIDNLNVSKAPSSVQIRNLVLYEKITS